MWMVWPAVTRSAARVTCGLLTAPAAATEAGFSEDVIAMGFEVLLPTEKIGKTVSFMPIEIVEPERFR